MNYSPKTVPIIRNPKIGLKFNLLKIGITALVTINIIRVSNFAPKRKRKNEEVIERRRKRE